MKIRWKNSNNLKNNKNNLSVSTKINKTIPKIKKNKQIFYSAKCIKLIKSNVTKDLYF